MPDTVVVAVLSLLGTLIGSFGGTQLIKYRIEQLEKKVEKHNSVVERTYLLEEKILMAIGVLAFLTSVITQVIKEMPGLKKIQTNAVALVVALILCPLAVVILCIYFSIQIIWYYIVGAMIAAFIVYLVATGGWEKVAEMWQRTKFNKHK